MSAEISIVAACVAELMANDSLIFFGVVGNVPAECVQQDG